MTTTPHVLASGNFSQSWTSTGLITASDDWSGVPSIVGYRGDDLTTVTATDPQTIVADGSGTPVDVNANQTNPNTNATGGVTEFDTLADPTVALQGSGTADAPHLVIYLNSSGRQNIVLSFNARDIDGSTDNAVQQIAVQYRVGGTGNYVNLPAGAIGDATTGPSLASLVTPVSVTLPAAAENQSLLEIRIMTTNAVGNDEWIGVDDILVTSAALATDTTPPTFTSSSAFTAEENQTAIGTVQATDPSTPVTYSLDGGEDVGLFSIDAISGVLTFNSAPDFEGASLDGDDIYEVTVRAADSASSPNSALQQIEVTVTDVNEAAATVSITDASITEGDAGTQLLTFTVSRSHNAGDFTVDYTTADNSASAGSDYVAVTGAPNTIQFTAGGALSQQISITINGDPTPEPTETFFVNLGNLVETSGSAIIADGQAIGTIVNDDVAPVRINEIDADQTGADTGEFIELAGGANISLNGYVVVLYNGSTDQSYAAFDLDGLSFDDNGYFLLGNAAVAAAAAGASYGVVFANNSLQNGADAVAIYLGSAADFPNGTAVTAANLVDAVVYENNHPDDHGLIDVLTPGQAQVNEAERGAGATQSLQRVPDGAGGALNTTAFTQATPTPGAANVLPATPAASGTVTHMIHDVQGNGASSPLSTGTVVTIEGVVVGDFQSGDSEVGRSLNGFYLEEENVDWDADALTSEGIFIFGGSTDVHEGDRVRVTGTVSEFFGMTEVTVTGVTVVSTGNTLPTAVDIDLPTAAVTLNQNNRYQPDLEAYEGMYVRIPETLTITEQFQLDRFNEIKLSAGGRLETFTNEFEPSTPGYAAYLQQIGARTITYDDGQNTQNESINYLDGFDPDDDATGSSATFPGEPGYGTANAYRMGDTVANLTGVLDYQFGGDSASSGATWRVRAINDGDNTFTSANERPDTPPIVGGTLKVASFNVLNYFTTLDAGGATTAIGLAPRGANTAAEFQRQTDKLVNFIATLDADVIGLTELENDFFDSNPNDGNPEGNAIGYLVAQLNARLGANTYAWVDPGSQLDSGQFFGGDAIAVGFIYKPSKVEVAFGTTIQKLDDSDPEAAALLPQSTIGHIFNGVNTSRAVLAVTFNEIATEESFTAVINHFKSKSGNGTGVDADQLDGQGAWQNQRELAAQALTDWIATHPTGTTDDDVLLLGDLNAYLKEDTLDLIKAAGFHNLAEELISNPYSYVFDAQYGALDHALASNSMASQVTGIEEWHINADEADALDYNLDFDRDGRYFDALSTARESDHDPVVIGLALNTAAPPVNVAPVNTVPGAQDVEANTATAIAGLSILDTDAGAGTVTTQLSVLHGTLAVASAGGAAVLGSGTATVALTGTVAQINATLGAANNVLYTGGHDYFGTDTLNVLTNDNGNTGTGGPATDSDNVAITLNTLINGTPGNDSYNALPGQEMINGLGGIDSITFGFKLVDATVTYEGNKVIIDGPSASHTVLTGFEVFNFTDGTVHNDDASPLIDDLFYYSGNHDVWNAHVDADTHYNVIGWKEGRDPDAFFDTEIYLSANADVKASGSNPLTHFDQFGWKEGRVPSLTFDPRQYLAANPDVAAAQIDPLWHFLTVGASEGRQPFVPSALIGTTGFDFAYYLNTNPDVKAAGVDPLWHFQTAGWHEGRNPNALFDVNGYLSNYGDVAAANVNPFDHYNQFGWHEGRDPSLGFDTTSYLAANPDVAAADVNPLWHFLQFGIHEGRSPFADGTWS
jgi:predicted extracellular nuclease